MSELFYLALAAVMVMCLALLIAGCRKLEGRK